MGVKRAVLKAQGTPVPRRAYKVMDQQVRNDQGIDDAAGGGYPEWLYRYATVAESGVQGLGAIGDEEVRSKIPRAGLPCRPQRLYTCRDA